MILRLLFVLAIMNLSPVAQAQVVRTTSYPLEKAERKPYKILTSGKQVTVKCTGNIKTIMVWTASGHRIVEQKAVGATSYSFRVTVKEKIFFIMLRMENGSHFTEKIGVN